MSIIDKLVAHGDLPPAGFPAKVRLELRGKTVYVAAPMTGIPDYNYPAIRAYTLALREAGFAVVSPVELDEAAGLGSDHELQARVEYMKRDLPALLECDLVAVLPGWHESAGARLEVTVALACGIRVVWADALALDGDLVDAATRSETTFEAHGVTEGSSTCPAASESHQTILEEAIGVVDNREGVYGHPADHFARTVGQLNALGFRFLTPAGDLRELEATDWPHVMIADKQSREMERTKRDNLTDIAGYTRTKERVMARLVDPESYAA